MRWRQLTEGMLVAAVLGLATLAQWVVTLRAEVAELQRQATAERARVDRLVERAVYYHGEAER